MPGALDERLPQQRRRPRFPDGFLIFLHVFHRGQDVRQGVHGQHRDLQVTLGCGGAVHPLQRRFVRFDVRRRGQGAQVPVQLQPGCPVERVHLLPLGGALQERPVVHPFVPAAVPVCRGDDRNAGSHHKRNGLQEPVVLRFLLRRVVPRRGRGVPAEPGGRVHQGRRESQPRPPFGGGLGLLDGLHQCRDGHPGLCRSAEAGQLQFLSRQQQLGERVHPVQLVVVQVNAAAEQPAGADGSVHTAVRCLRDEAADQSAHGGAEGDGPFRFTGLGRKRGQCVQLVLHRSAQRPACGGVRRRRYREAAVRQGLRGRVEPLIPGRVIRPGTETMAVEHQLSVPVRRDFRCPGGSVGECSAQFGYRFCRRGRGRCRHQGKRYGHPQSC